MTRDEQHEYDFTMYRDCPDTFKEELPNFENDDPCWFYTDQAVNRLDLQSINGPTITSFLTEYGIRELDSWMCKQIKGSSKFTKDELTRLIRRNPHLHNIIKTNLLINLKNARNYN